MRLKAGRPDLRTYRERFDTPSATEASPVTVKWAGVTTLLVSDGTSAVMTDGFFSRPDLLTVGLRRLAPSPRRVGDCLTRLDAHRLDAVLPVHTHFDHALDSALVADRTGATLIGGRRAGRRTGARVGLPVR